MSKENRERESSPEFERITPVSLRTPAASTQRRRKPAASANWLTWAAFCLLLIAAAGVFFVLPKVARDPAPATDSMQASAPPAPESVSPAPRKPAAPQPQARRAREQAERWLARLVEKQSALRGKAVHLWGGRVWADARTQVTRGDKFFVAENFQRATQAYKRALRMMDALAGRAESVFATAMRAGNAALGLGDDSKAIEQFERALAIQADHEPAAQGLARARNLAEVLELLNTGTKHEARGALKQAATAYRKAVERDPKFAPAQAALAGIERQLTEQQFGRAMSQGFAALAREDFVTARAAFETARELKPNAAEAADGLAQVDARVRLQQIAAHRDQAARLEAEENWRAAAEHYSAALKLDPNLVFAKDGLARSLARAQLAERLDFHIAHPERLSADGVYASAAALLEQARAVANKGPKLQMQNAALSELLRRATTPVPVRLHSDNLTEVVVYHVSALGTFDTRELELRPGRYTVVGSRDGYRDVRREFKVVAGEIPAPVVVRCVEPI